MKKSFLMVAMAAFGTLFVTSTTFAQTANPSTAGTVTAICKDGTTYSGTTLKGACHGHHGVDKHAAGNAGAASASAAVAPAAKLSPVATPSTMAQAPGGGAGKVWVNTSTKVYHCAGDKYYGKTKAGAYMSEADAKTKGYHADHGKTCQ